MNKIMSLDFKIYINEQKVYAEENCMMKNSHSCLLESYESCTVIIYAISLLAIDLYR